MLTVVVMLAVRLAVVAGGLAVLAVAALLIRRRLRRTGRWERVRGLVLTAVRCYGERGTGRSAGAARALTRVPAIQVPVTRGPAARAGEEAQCTRRR